MVLQNKWDIYHSGKQLDHIGEDVLALCRQHDIKLIGYSPLSSFPFVMIPVRDPLVETLARKKGVTAAEVSVVNYISFFSDFYIQPKEINDCEYIAYIYIHDVCVDQAHITSHSNYIAFY